MLFRQILLASHPSAVEASRGTKQTIRVALNLLGNLENVHLDSGEDLSGGAEVYAVNAQEGVQLEIRVHRANSASPGEQIQKDPLPGRQEGQSPSRCPHQHEPLQTAR